VRGAGGLAWLLDPVPPQRFLREFWEERPLVVRRARPDYFGELLTLDDIDRVLTTLDRRYPDVVVKHVGRDIAASDYTIDGTTIDVAKLYQLFEEGATLSLAFLDTVLPSLERFCREIEVELSMPLQANVYLTPPNEQGADVHYDTHDVFVLQVSGSKQWTLYDAPVPLPLTGQVFNPDVHSPGAPTQEFELGAGDVLYIPRGWMHQARTTSATSLHITVGVLRYTWADLLLELVSRAALEEPAFRKALPVGFARERFDRAPARETLRGLLLDLQTRADADADAVLDHFVDRFIADCPPLLRGQMRQLELLKDLTLETALGARPGTVHRLRREDAKVIVESHGRRITFPAYAEEAVAFAVARPRYRLRELPGGLDEAGRLALGRRLIRDGLVSILPSARVPDEP
jgi:mannose-6-phosphate isomerase-like protein (cupin superfamily)